MKCGSEHEGGLYGWTCLKMDCSLFILELLRTGDFELHIEGDFYLVPSQFRGNLSPPIAASSYSSACFEVLGKWRMNDCRNQGQEMRAIKNYFTK